jgi:hypothetical protein
MHFLTIHVEKLDKIKHKKAILIALNTNEGHI